VTGSKDSPDEAFDDTARREVWEETGIDCRPNGLLCGALSDWFLENTYEIYPAWRKRYAPEVSHNTEHVFGLCVPARTPVLLSPTEHTAHQWLPWREAADRCFSPSNAEAILLLPQLGR
jgi:dATP pyrophosphohydrolase